MTESDAIELLKIIDRVDQRSQNMADQMKLIVAHLDRIAQALEESAHASRAR